MATTKIEALGAILTSLGKTPTARTTNGLLVEISEAVSEESSDGSFIPAVTSADNGKVLGVVDGHWAVMDLASFIQDNTGS
jgi:hypothetical protein